MRKKSKGSRWSGLLIPAALMLLLAFTAISGCTSKKQGLRQAADHLCQAAKIGLNPPEEAYQAFAKRMNVDLSDLKEHGKKVVGMEAFAAHLKASHKEIPGQAQKIFADLFAVAASADPARRLAILREGFAEHGVDLSCPELQRFYSPQGQ